MYEQVNCEQSYISLSAFLCLDSKKQPDDKKQLQKNQFFINPIKKIDPAVINNPCRSEINFEGIQHFELQLEDQQHMQDELGGRQRKEKKDYSKNYRKRQKDLVQNLRKMNEKYQKRIDQLQLKVEQMQQEIYCLKYGRQISGKIFDSTFVKEKEETLKELVIEAEQKKESTWEQIKQFNFVYGFAGTQKINLLNYYMSQIIDNLLIDSHKNFAMNGLNDFQIATPWAQRLEDKEMEIIGYTSSDTTQLRKFFKKLMPLTLKAFHKCGQEFYQSYVKLISAAKQIENNITQIQDGLFRLIAADKYLAILRWYEENKFSRDLQQMRREWFESFRKN